jgi:hypothetical protein
MNPVSTVIRSENSTTAKAPVGEHRTIRGLQMETIMHKFKVGQAATFTGTRLGQAAAALVCKVVRLMPSQNGVPIYRIKCASEPFERVAKESDLE